MAQLLVITSKVKSFIKSQGCQTSGTAIEQLSKVIEQECNRAVVLAKRDGRKTVMAKDVGVG